MKKTILILTVMTMVCGQWSVASSQPGHPATQVPENSATKTPTHPATYSPMETSFIVNVNTMDDERQSRLNDIASQYRARRSSVLMASMMSAGAMSLFNVVEKEVRELVHIRSNQKRAWSEQRNRENHFVDSLQSVGGQNDFYRHPSQYGPLDPSDMNFDGITLRAYRDGYEALCLVCHLDTSRLNELFLHSRFHLVVDSLIFRPYHAFLPNLGLPHDSLPASLASYRDAISRFSFEEQQNPEVTVNLDVYSSWINDATEVFQDIPLGSFSVRIPIHENDLHDSVYTYSRRQALADGTSILNMNGSSFVVPRSYMPVAYDQPSWGTGEYKMKVRIAQDCRTNPVGPRSKHWRRDYRQITRLQNHGRRTNPYFTHLVTTFRDNGYSIIKATYDPAVKKTLTFGNAATPASGYGSRPQGQ